MVRVAPLVAALIASVLTGCRLDELPLPGVAPTRDLFGDAATDAPAAPKGDAGSDASVCEVDLDRDGSCAGDDCDDLNSRRSPLRGEYCPDVIDNDCDGLVDFDDDCDTLNDVCDGPLTVLVQDPDIDPSTWAFDLPLGARYRDDVSAGLSAGASDCTGDSGRNGHDAYFQITAATDATVTLTARGLGGVVAVLVLRAVCEAGQAGDACDVEDAQPATISGVMSAGQTAWLIVDDNATSATGLAHVEIRIAKRVVQ